MKPYLSIVIPTLNEAEYLPRLLDDLEEQQNITFEVIVIDSSSNDKTMNVLHPHKRSFMLYYHKVTKQNVSYQKNEGARHAQGLYVVFLDADSRIESDFIQNIVNTIITEPGLIYRPYIVPDDKEYFVMDQLIFVWNILVRLSFHTSTPFGDGGCLIFERHLFMHIGGFNEEVLAEDYEIMRRCVQWGVKPRFAPHIIVIISLRRFKRDNKIILLRNQIYSIMCVLLKKEIKIGTIRHDMGGDL